MLVLKDISINSDLRNFARNIFNLKKKNEFGLYLYRSDRNNFFK